MPNPVFGFITPCHTHAYPKDGELKTSEEFGCVSFLRNTIKVMGYVPGLSVISGIYHIYIGVQKIRHAKDHYFGKPERIAWEKAAGVRYIVRGTIELLCIFGLALAVVDVTKTIFDTLLICSNTHNPSQ